MRARCKLCSRCESHGRMQRRRRGSSSSSSLSTSRADGGRLAHRARRRAPRDTPGRCSSEQQSLSTKQADRGRLACRGAPPRAAGHSAAVQQHVLQRDGQRGVVPVHDHAHAVADQQDVYACCIHLPRVPHQRQLVRVGAHRYGLRDWQRCYVCI